MKKDVDLSFEKNIDEYEINTKPFIKKEEK